MSKLKQMQLEDSDLAALYEQQTQRNIAGAARAIKIAIIGVSGDIGSKAAENLMVLAEKTKQRLDLVLYSRQSDDDIKHGSNKAEGKTRDLKSKYGLNPNAYARVTSSVDYKDLAGAEAVIFAAGTRAGKIGASTREELLPFNIGITKEAADNIKHYSPDAFVFVVPNPVDMITQIMQELTEFKPEKVLGLGTSLDTARFRVHLQEELQHHYNIPDTSIDAAVIGYHNKEGMILSSNSIRINGKTAEKFAESGAITKENLDTAISTAYQHTLNEGFEIVKLMGGHGPSSFPAMMAARAVLAYTSYSFTMEPVPLSIVENGICQSRLLKITKGAIQLRDPKLTENEQTRLTEEMSKFSEQRAHVGDASKVGQLAQKFDKQMNAKLAELEEQKAAMAHAIHTIRKSPSHPLHLVADQSSGSSSLSPSHAQRILQERNFGQAGDAKVIAERNHVKFILKVNKAIPEEQHAAILAKTLKALGSAMDIDKLESKVPMFDYPIHSAHIPFTIDSVDITDRTIKAFSDLEIRYNQPEQMQSHSASPPKTPLAHPEHERARSASPVGHVDRLRALTPTAGSVIQAASANQR